MTKSILSSKTVIVALLQGIIGVLIAAAAIQPELGQILIAKSILDIFLRVITTTEVVL